MNWQTYLETHDEQFLGELLDLIRIPSISSLPDHAEDVNRAAVWVTDRLKTAGVEHVEIMPTGGHPVVYGDWLHATGKPTILIYGHFDVQPVDPLELWEHPPFAPHLTEDRIYARGASDDKGGMITPILAVEALLKTEGALPVNVKFCFEGQEEIGSPQIPDFLAAHREKFAAQLVISADGLQWSADQPMLVTGLKGLAGAQIDVVGPRGDLHSGLHGGVLQNPLEALARILATMRYPDGRIAIDGFYDDVIDLTPEARAHIAAVPFDGDGYQEQLGIDGFFGEPGYSVRERNWFRPTLEVNGMWGGFQGDGTKTVIPSAAHAKITCRLVADQNPTRIVELITTHVARHTPPGVKATVSPLQGSALPFLMPADHPAHLLAAEVLTRLYDGNAPYFVGVGGSVPVISVFLKELGAYTLNFGWSIGDEQLHAPNEFFRLENFRRGPRGYVLLLQALADYRG